MNNVLHYAMNIGELMLQCGADVRRVEESISRICYSYDAQRIDIFIVTTSIVATLYCHDGTTYTETRKISGVDTDMERLHFLNNLSRRICKEHMSFEDIDKELLKLNECKKFKLPIEVAAYAMIGCAFTLFFGGNIIEAIVSLIIGGICRFSALLAEKSSMSRLFTKFFCSFVSTILAYIALKLDIINVVDKVIIGNIMVLIPGIGITNALKDLLSGDNVAGVFRTVEAALYGLSIAAGYMVVAYVMGGVL